MNYIITYIVLMIFMTIFCLVTKEIGFAIFIMVSAGMLYLIGLVSDIYKAIKEGVKIDE